VANYQPIIYQLAHVAPPTRFVLPAELGTFAASSGATSKQELQSVLAGHPRYIVMSDPPLEALPAAMRDAIEAELAGCATAISFRDGSDGGRAVTLYVRR
jgi:hypothetical protein